MSSEVVTPQDSKVAETPADKVETPAKDVAPADSSAAEPSVKAENKGEKGDNILDAVKAALKEKEPKQEKPPASGEQDSKPEDKPADAKEGDEGEAEGDFTEEELTRLNAKTKKRIEGLLGERVALREEVAAVKPKAEQFDRIVSFVEEAGLAPGEVNDLFDIGKNLKSDPRKAYDQIKPVFQQLQRMFGDVLPDDLQQQVNIGAMTETAAKQLAATRSDASIAQQNLERQRERDAQRQKSESHQVHVNAVQTEVSKWEATKAKADPDWNLKLPQVMQAIELAFHKQGFPPTAADAVKLADDALKSVNDQFAKLVPKRKEITPVTDVTSTRSTPKPTTALEAAKAALAKTRAA